MRAFIGYDPREESAFTVAARTLLETSGIEAEPLVEQKLRVQGLLWRPVDRRGHMHDLVSGADQATEFAISRFLVPFLCQTGWALFTDCDVVFLRDVRDMLVEVEPGKAVYVVRHNFKPTAATKMDGQAQTQYPRKAWSSVMLFDVGHPANRRLNLHHVNTMPGRDLHALFWLNDDEIGSLSPAWNWLVDQQPRPDNLGIAHLTAGGPWFPGWRGGSFDDEWKAAAGWK